MSNRVLSDSDLEAGSGSDGGAGAGNKSDSDSSVGASTRPKRSGVAASGPVMDSDDSEADSGSDWEASNKSKKMKKKKAPGRRRPTDEAEDGELSGDDGESDSDAELGSGDEYDGLFENEEDRKRVEAMTEKEREVEIYKRMEKRDMDKKRREIERRLDKKARQSQKDSSPPTKRPKTSSERAKVKEKESLSSLVALRKKKAEKEAAAAKKKAVMALDEVFGSGSDSDSDEPPPRRRTTSSSSHSSSSGRPRRRSRSLSGSSSDSGEDFSSIQKKRAISSKEELELARISRFKLAKFVHYPFFEKTVVGCFVRVGIGRNQAGREVYRICQIVGVVQTGKVYDVEKTTTNKGLKLRFGGNERVFRLAFVSNNHFEDSEFAKWKEEMGKAGHPVPSVEHCEKKEKDIKAALSHRMTDADIDFKIKEKRKFSKNPTNFAVEKTNLIKQRVRTFPFISLPNIPKIQPQNRGFRYVGQMGI